MKKALTIILLFATLLFLNACSITNNLDDNKTNNNIDNTDNTTNTNSDNASTLNDFENDYFFPSEGTSLNIDRFEPYLAEYMNENMSESTYNILNNYIPEDKSEEYNLDAFIVGVDDKTYFFLWCDGVLYSLTNISSKARSLNKYNKEYVHFAITDLDKDGYIEILVSINNNIIIEYANKKPAFDSRDHLIIINTKEKKLSEHQELFNKYAYFKECDNDCVGVYTNPTGIKYTLKEKAEYDECTELYTTVQKRNLKFTFENKEFEVMSDNYKVDIQINLIELPVAFSNNSSFFKMVIKMTYLGETFSYVSSSSYLEGAECIFKNGENIISCDITEFGDDVLTDYTIEAGTEITKTRTYAVEATESIVPGTYDMEVSYRGETAIAYGVLNVTKND